MWGFWSTATIRMMRRSLFFKLCVLLLLICLIRLCRTEVIGGSIRTTRTLSRVESPYIVKSDLVVDKDGKLVIEPGVEVQFQAGVGITVKGTLVAEGEKDQHIVFTRTSTSSTSWRKLVNWSEARLVDGDSPFKGRLQLYYKEKWRSVCTNSKNWTETDLQVACQQLGYTGGVIYHWFHKSSSSSQLLYENPNCTGSESSLSECPLWSQRQLGSGVCDYHQDIGIQCEPNLHERYRNHWAGIRFIHAKAKKRRLQVLPTYQWVSLSSLNYVSVLYAGCTSDGQVTSAITVIGYPPKLSNLDVRYSAFTGLNFTQPGQSFVVSNSQVTDNHGYGMYINTSSGQGTLQGVSVENNLADGVRYVFHDNYFLSKENFCSSVNFGKGQVYPLQLTHSQSHDLNYVQECEKLFELNHKYGEQLTVHFPALMSDELDEASASVIEVYSGRFVDPKLLLGRFPVINNTRLQSFTSTRDSILVRYKPVYNRMVFFTVEVVASFGRAQDLELNACNITKNMGRGVVVENMRSGVILSQTYVAKNTHVAGLHVLGGAGDVIMNNSAIVDNIGDGINISYSGGYQHYNLSVISRNTKIGIALWFNETSTTRAFNFTTHFTNSEIVGNGEYGMLIGNICRADSFWNISMNTFKQNNDAAVKFLSCWFIKTNYSSSVEITNNKFSDSRKLAVHFAPALHLKATIAHNHFMNHQTGVLFISNRYFDVYREVEVFVIIKSNLFQHNKGMYTSNIGVLDGSKAQKILFTKNIMLQNEISEPFPALNPRSRVAAVVVVSSSNVDLVRNHFENPLSRYELGSHLEGHNKVIKASLNYWGRIGKNQVRELYERIFDRKNRYNLARIEFLQFLIFQDLNTEEAISNVDESEKIIWFKNDKVIGGEVMGNEELAPGTYQVVKDIFIRSGSHLKIHPGVNLQFEHSIGIMVQGKLESEGQGMKINFGITSQTKKTSLSTNVRLSNNTEGRLEVQVNNRWGTVCLYGWDTEDAAVACHQLGLVLHPQDWLLEKSQFQDQESSSNVILSNVQCTELDTDLTTCKAERDDDFENSCTMIVGIRCYQPSWAGIRLGMDADESIIRNVVIQEAGLLDYATHIFKPALQLDLSHHQLSDLEILGNPDSGIGFMWNDIFYFRGNQKISKSKIIRNRLHGIITHSQGLDIIENEFAYNGGSGIHYDPVFTKAEHMDLLSWITTSSSHIILPRDARNYYRLPQNSRKYVFFEDGLISERRSDIEFKILTDSGMRIGIMILNPFSKESTEEMMVYGALEVREDVPVWDIRNNLTSFPLRSPGSAILVKYRRGNKPVGDAILYIASVGGYTDTYLERKVPTINIEKNMINSCKHGISSNHYNRDESELGAHFHRYDNETILIAENNIFRSKKEAVLVSTPFWDHLVSNLAEINYTLVYNTIRNNGKGILQYSRDIRNSNNLFHWKLMHSLLKENHKGGLNIRFPYVWHYNENYTHTLIVLNSSFVKNENFGFRVDGHFARIKATKNIFMNNTCKYGLIHISGMEKEMLIQENKLKGNTGRYVVEFDLFSHADQFGIVSANFKNNVLENNKYYSESLRTESYNPASYALGIRGVQQINITRNLFSNPIMHFEFLAGVLTGSLHNQINVAENWWGTLNVTEIQKRIFDFDDWNSYAVAEFSPYLEQDNMASGVVKAEVHNKPVDVDSPLGGRIYKTLTLPYRKAPYSVVSDLTILPNAKLIIEPGVQLMFYPSVGILVLGDLEAKGTIDHPIKMIPAKTVNSTHGFQREPSKAGIRLCVTPKCKEAQRYGFLEVFNSTTLQWVPVCDPCFTERNAEVICHELGYVRHNAYFKQNHRYDLGTTTLSRVRFWPHPLECTGREDRFSDCEYRLNGYGEHNYSCSYEGNHVFVYCGEDNLDRTEEYWGGIRFSVPNFERQHKNMFVSSRMLDRTSSSWIEYVTIRGAGILHGEKNGALQLVQRSINLHRVTITHSASHAIEVLASPGNLFFNKLLVKNNFGFGISYSSLLGESSDSSSLSYHPLKEAGIPYSVFGFVDICDANKRLMVEEKLLLYYKYDNMPVDCVKIFSSTHGAKPVGFRLLQLNLFDATSFSAQPDILHLFDGDIFNSSAFKLGEIKTNNGNTEHTGDALFYRSTGNTLSIKLHANGGSQVFGFVAEVVTLPITYYIARGLQHNVTHSVLSNNQQGAIRYLSAGESTPHLTFSYNRMEYNGRKLFGNITTSEGAVVLNLENTPYLDFHNNLLLQNQGGFIIEVDAKQAVASLSGLITNNLFVENKNQETFLARGRDSGSYQVVEVTRNYFTRNYALYKDNIVLDQVRANFSLNLVVNNKGLHQLRMVGSKNVQVSQQVCQNNWLWNNVALMNLDRSTIVAGSAGQLYRYNYLENPDSDFELASTNRTLALEMRENPIRAAENWWGFNTTSAVAGRIKDFQDNPKLLEVLFLPYYTDNSSVLNDKCAGGWHRIGDTCFLYIGGILTYGEAKKFCQMENASMPFIKQHHKEIMYFMSKQQEYFKWNSHMVWVQSIDVPLDKCSVLYKGKVQQHHCDDSLPFLCEKDPEITVSIHYWYQNPVGSAALGVSAGAILFISLCVSFWVCKSRHRQREKLERRNSIRASNRALAATEFGKLGFRRRLEHNEKSVPVKIEHFNGSIDSVDKTPHYSCSFDNAHSDITETKNPTLEFPVYENHYTSNLQMENETVSTIAQPSFDMAYENQGFREHSLSQISRNGSHEWSTGTDSTLDMKRSLEMSQDVTSKEPKYQNTPSPRSSQGSYCNSFSSRQLLETAM
ncbi:protein bark beetle-like [Tachypleus tridentatus]|uniref:protein bark beetle-like n=1 Tax=Tachypleus tridentatus TaxID=6853 RepID=UPI003FD22D5C